MDKTNIPEQAGSSNFEERVDVAIEILSSVRNNPHKSVVERDLAIYKALCVLKGEVQI